MTAALSMTQNRGETSPPLQFAAGGALPQVVAAMQERIDALERAQRRDRMALQVSGMGTWTRDMQTGLVEWSAELIQIFGLPPGQHPRSHEEFFEFVHPEDRERFAEVMRQALLRREDYDCDFRYLHSSGEYRWMRGRGRGFFDEQGRLTELAGVGIEITPQKRAEQALVERESQLRQIGDNLPEGALYQVVATPGGKRKFIHWSAGIERLTGVSAEEAMRDASSLYSLIHPDDAAKAAVMEERTVREGGIYDIVVRLRHRTTGEWRWVHLRSAQRTLPDGTLVWDGIYSDITDKHHAQRALHTAHAQLEGFFRANIVGVVIADVQGQVFEANDYFLNLLGYSRDELNAGTVRWDTVTPPEHLATSQRAISQMFERGSSSMYEKEYERRDGTRVAVLVAGALLPGDEHNVAAFVLDITERKRAEEKLHDADRRKNEFLAMLAHELRNPLSAIRNALLLCSERGADPESFGWARGVMDRQSQQLSRLVDDLLDVSRITRGRIELRKEKIDAAPLLDHAVEAVRPLLTERQHQLIRAYGAAQTLTLEADPARLEQIVCNLLMNAAKYTNPGGHIWLEAHRVGTEIIITVRDTGVGIPQERIGEMFELFAQGERSLARSEGGLGLGLTIVRTLVEMHGGQITAKSGGNMRGSEFTVRLPASDLPKSRRPRRENPQETGKRTARILVVDDNADTADSLTRLLKRRGHTVETVYDGHSALEAASSSSPDFILLDLGLPGLDGFQVAAGIRARESAERSVIIAVSGYGQEEDRRKSKEAGFDHHLVKPVDFDQLHALLATREHATPG